jgi:diguanylate cyclase (GGDEF)-like protein
MCCQHFLCFIPALVALLAIILLLGIKLRNYFRLSETDELTSIPNYRGFRRKLRKVIAAGKMKSAPFSIAILDIDGFKRFNDQSYAFGDIVMKDFVRFLKVELPEDTFLARFRFGDEFIMILNCNAEKASAILKNIWASGKDKVQTNQHYKTEYTITFSYGVAGFENETDTIESMLNKSEISLKESKRSLEK